VLTWCSNVKGKELFYNNFFNTLRNYYSGDIVVVTNENNLSLKVDNKFITSVKINNILCDRHFVFWDFLKNRKYDNVLIADSRDIIFQDNPFNYLNHKMMLTEEGFLHQDSAFNCEEQFFVKKTVGLFDSDFLNQPVVNGGVIIGESSCVKDFCFLIWSNCLRYPGVTDQAVINHLISYLKTDKDYHISSPHLENFCLTGETVKRNYVKYKNIDGFACNNLNQKYCIFHQYDRVENFSLLS
jgi:hypothetical protein